MASFSIANQVWENDRYTITFDFSWNVKTDDNTLRVYLYHSKATLLTVEIPSGILVWNDETSNSAVISGFNPYLKCVATFAGITLTFNVKPHPNHISDSYYPSYYPTMQTQMYQYDFSDFSVRGETGCCATSTLVAVREKIEHDIRPNSNRKYSSSWIYGAIRQSGDDDTGMATSEALAFLVNVGVPTYRKIKKYNVNTYPDVYVKQNQSKTYNGVTNIMTGAVQRYNNTSSNSYAHHGRISSWRRVSIFDTFEIMKHITGHMKSACLDIVVSEEFDNACRNLTTTKGVVPRLNQFSTNRGAHSMIILGWKKIGDEYYWICQNSWGRKHPFDGGWWDEANWKEVGDNGLIYVPFSYVPRTTNNVVDGGVYNVYLIDGNDYGSDEFKWNTPKAKGEKFNLTKTEWDTLQDYINECLGYKNKSAYSFTRAVSGQPFTAVHYNEIATTLYSSNYLGSTIDLPWARSGIPISADEHLNKLVESLNSAT